MSAPFVLPDCRPKIKRRQIQDADGVVWSRIYCANCGNRGGMVTEESVRHCFYLCRKCGESHGQMPEGTVTVPDQVFYARMREAMMEKYNRLLSVSEIASAVAEESNPLSKLAREFVKPPVPRGS